jgi:hypothetical protein
VTRDEAASVAAMVVNTWPQPSWTPQEAESFVDGIVPLDAELAVQAVALAHGELDARPTVQDMRDYVRAARIQRDQQQHVSRHEGRMPGWVREWVCARYLHGRFNRPQDMRPFRQQVGGGPVPPDVELMPDGAWAAEAATVGDAEALRELLKQPWMEPAT